MTCLEPQMPKVPHAVAPTEKLGRCVFSTSHFKASLRTVGFRAFLEDIGNENLSVDRLTFAPLQEAVRSGEIHGLKRGRSFYGWAVLTTLRAAADGRSVVADPVLGNDANPYHANTVLSDSDLSDAQKHHAQQLASVSVWLARP